MCEKEQFTWTHVTAAPHREASQKLQAASSLNNMFQLSLRQDVKHRGLRASQASL